MPILGAHLSIAGGYYKAADAAGKFGMETVQVFTKNNNQWRAKAIGDEESQLFLDAVKRSNLQLPTSHASYLINLGSFSDELWQKSIDAMVVELARATLLGIHGVVLHPGSHGDHSQEEGIVRVVAAIDRIHEAAPKGGAKILLETTAGQGNNLGWRFEHLSDMIAKSKQSERLRVCVDTCHLFAAGYPLIDHADYVATFREFDSLIGIERIAAFHLNDSKKDFGSRVDRHEHIGHGKLGLEPFRHLLTDNRFKEIPMYLETPKGIHEGEEWDAINLRQLRSLLQ
jgi:deoxyribonuclease-4